MTVRRSSNPEIAGTAARLVDGARAAGDLVVWILHSQPGSGMPFDPASGHVRLLEPLAPGAGEPALTKTSHNAFTTTNLQQLLTRHGVTELVVCGIRAEQCCETTARIGSDLGYQVTFVTEATATNPVAHRDAPARQTVAELLALRTERSQHLIGQGATVESAAVAVGFTDARMLRRLRSRTAQPAGR
jgi:nicotinamidase-related amidase